MAIMMTFQQENWKTGLWELQPFLSHTIKKKKETCVNFIYFYHLQISYYVETKPGS